MPETPRSDGDAYADAYDEDEDQIAAMEASGTAKTPAPSEKKAVVKAVVDDSDEEDSVGINDDDDDDDDDDAKELAEMFAKVQTIQKAEGIQVKPVIVKSLPSRGDRFDQLEVVVPDQSATKRSGTTPKSSTSSSSSLRSRTLSPAGSNVAITRSPDGIKTISRKATSRGQATASIDVLSGVKKPELFQNRLLQTVKQQPKALEQMKQKVVAAAPATIAKRIESLSEPKKSDTGRKFAQDDEEKHCRFRMKKKNKDGGGREAFEDDDNGGSNRTSDFIARMEAAERNRQKKLELTRGEKEYLANLNKKVCPKCEVPQSYSEYRDKKKRCQMCGSEFRVPQAWGDVGSEFISRISEDVRQRDERKEQIKAQVVYSETASGRVSKSATQQHYEKSLQQRNEHKTFLDRNYTVSATKSSSTSSSSKTMQAQAQLQIKLQAQRAKLLAAAQPPIY